MISLTLKNYLSKVKSVFLPKINNLTDKCIVFIIEIFHCLFAIFVSFGVILFPPKFIKYNIIFLIFVLLGWYIFEGCWVENIKNYLFDIPKVNIIGENVIILAVLLILFNLFIYFNPSKSPYTYIYN